MPTELSVKRQDYYESDRRDFLDWVGGRFERVLDVGCGAGANVDWYRAHGAVHVTGIEIDPDSASAAERILDRVICGSVEDALERGDVGGPFDLIVCADVLEHLLDPWSVLAQLRQLATDRTVLAMSVPNIRYLRALARIAVGRGFEYEERGTFDATHLRFFVPDNVAAMARKSGWHPTRMGAPSSGRLGSVRRVAHRVTLGWSDQWLGLQTYVRAVPDPARSARPTVPPP